MDGFSFTQSQRQRWMAVLAHSLPAELQSHWQALGLSPDYTLIRPAESGLTQIQARAGASGQRFFLGDATLTRAVVQLSGGAYGYSYLLGRDKARAERCAVIDALLQTPSYHEMMMQRLINPLDALRRERLSQRARAVATSRVDFFTLVRGDN